MKVEIQTTEIGQSVEVRVGNVYPVKGGRGMRYGHMQVLIAITEGDDYRSPAGLMLVIDKQGNPVGVNSYGMHYIDDLCPIAFVEGIDTIRLVMRSL